MDLVIEEEVIVTDYSDYVLTITLNRPHVLNAINTELSNELRKCLIDAEKNPDIRVIILTGSGRAFCAGADLKEVSQRKNTPEELERFNKGEGITFFMRSYFSKPIIAAVNGFALGGGFELALSCDLIVATDESKFSLPEVKRGILAAAGGLLRLPRQIPQKVAMEMVLTGKTCSAKTLENWGLINYVVSQEQLMLKANELAKQITTNAPLAVRESKRVILEGLDCPLTISGDAWNISDNARANILSTEDAKEGPLAFVEKRTPIWKGK